MRDWTAKTPGDPCRTTAPTPPHDPRSRVGPLPGPDYWRQFRPGTNECPVSVGEGYRPLGLEFPLVLRFFRLTLPPPGHRVDDRDPTYSLVLRRRSRPVQLLPVRPRAQEFPTFLRSSWPRDGRRLSHHRRGGNATGGRTRPGTGRGRLINE